MRTIACEGYCSFLLLYFSCFCRQQNVYLQKKCDKKSYGILEDTERLIRNNLSMNELANFTIFTEYPCYIYT